MIGRSVLSTRPSGSNNSDIYAYMQKKYKQPVVNLFGTKIKARPKLFGLIAGIAIASPAIFYFLGLSALTGDALRVAKYSMASLLMSIDLVVGIGVGIGVYVRSTVSYLIKTKREMEKMESEFTSAIFELGNLISENIPAEIAFGRVAKVLKKTEIAKLFYIIDDNLRREGVGLRDSIFNPKFGALSYYPSALMKGVFNLMIEGARKGPKIVAKSLTTISEYMRAVHKVDERLKDLLADTVASMTMQVKMFIPIITGIVVGLAALTSKVLLALGDQLSDFAVGFEGEAAADYSISTQLLSIFQIDHMTPQFVFQLIVGIYVVQVIMIISYLLSGITYGRDDIEARDILSKNLFIGTVFYGILAAATSVAFSALIGNLNLV